MSYVVLAVALASARYVQLELIYVGLQPLFPVQMSSFPCGSRGIESGILFRGSIGKIPEQVSKYPRSKPADRLKRSESRKDMVMPQTCTLHVLKVVVIAHIYAPYMFIMITRKYLQYRRRRSHKKIKIQTSKTHNFVLLQHPSHTWLSTSV